MRWNYDDNDDNNIIYHLNKVSKIYNVKEKYNSRY